MSKYILNPKFLNSQMFAKTESGQEVLITKDNFNDYWAERMLEGGQNHLVQLSNEYISATEVEKKTFIQVSENVIISTLRKELIEESEPKKTARVRKSKQKDGQQLKATE